MSKKLKIILLKKARVLIENFSERFICHALDEAADDLGTEKARNASEELKDMIMSRLQPNYSYENWLEAKHLYIYVANSQSYDNGFTFIPLETIAPARLVWIDAMIKELR